MDLSSNVAKIIGGVGAASVTAVATGIGIDQNNKHQKALEEEKARQEELDKQNALKEEENKRILAEQKIVQEAVGNIKRSTVGQKNWFGGGLYEFLEDQDIVFKVFKGKDSTEELTKENFKIDKNQGLTIKVEILISENSNQLKTSSSGKVKIEHLKALKGGTDWTWSCHIKFSPFSSGTGISSYELGEKDKFFNDKQDGFFDVLTKDLTQENNDVDKTKWKNIKKRFIEKCSNANKGQSQLELNWTTFSLKTQDSDGKGNLYFFNMQGSENAKEWFDENITIINHQ